MSDASTITSSSPPKASRAEKLAEKVMEGKVVVFDRVTGAEYEGNPFSASQVKLNTGALRKQATEVAVEFLDAAIPVLQARDPSMERGIIDRQAADLLYEALRQINAKHADRVPAEKAITLLKGLCNPARIEGLCPENDTETVALDYRNLGWSAAHSHREERPKATERPGSCWRADVRSPPRSPHGRGDRY